MKTLLKEISESTLWKALGIISVIGIFYSFILVREKNITIKVLESRVDTVEVEIHKYIDTCSYNLDTLNISDLKKAIKDFGIKYPDIVLKQALLETGNFTSSICKENHNLFGMKHPRKRETVSLGKKRGHAHYNHWLDSVKDYRLWQDEMYRGGNYIAFLDKIYATDNQYVEKLINI